jgi:hypothetical protein
MNCQIPDCKNKAVWRIVDYYKQQRQTYGPYFYYWCNHHKKLAASKKAPGHKIETQRI